MVEHRHRPTDPPDPGPTSARPPRRVPRLVAAGSVVVLALVAGAVVALGLQRDGRAADAAASASASVAARALADDAAARGAAADRAAARVAASSRAAARAGLLEAVEQGTATLDETRDEVADDAVREALADVLQRAKHALESTPADAPDGDDSAAALRALAAEVRAARDAVVRAHEEWDAARQAEAEAARARESERARETTPPARAPDDDRCRTTYDGPPFYTSPPTEGGDGSNGRLPPSALTATSWGVDPKGTRYYLRSSATAALERLNVAFRAEFGHDLDLDLTYRDYETQVAMREALGPIAAKPGTSKHGTGLALDVPELPCEYGYGTPQHTWLVEQGPRWGWVQPSWARQGGSNPEYWHFEYVG